VNDPEISCSVLQRFLLLTLPFAAIAGNALADAWLVLITLTFLISSTVQRRWNWLKQGWVIVAIIFWSWAMFCSAVSEWPKESLNDSVAWIRFPLFAVAVAETLRLRPRLLEQFFLSVIVATVLVAIYILIERLTHSSADRIYGPLGMERPGWYLLGFGLPTVLLARYYFLAEKTPLAVSLSATVLIVTAIFASYQIYVTFALLLGLTIYSILTTSKAHIEVAVLVVILSSVALILLGNEVLNERFTTEVMRTLPWQDSSRYYNFWAGGLTTALENLAYGVGPNNYDFYCNNVVNMNGPTSMGFFPGNPVDGCSNHPHQRYLQIAAETGVVGLILFIAIGATLIFQSLRCWSHSRAAKVSTAVAISLLVVNFWPISTFSEAFGQKLNFFYWFHIGLALVFLNLSRVKSSRNTDISAPQ
jgi:O-antigen ligase